MIMNSGLGLSLTTNEIAAPDKHIMTTLYTLIPMYLESFRAEIVTCRVSHAKKHPNTWIEKCLFYITARQIYICWYL